MHVPELVALIAFKQVRGGFLFSSFGCCRGCLYRDRRLGPPPEHRLLDSGSLIHRHDAATCRSFCSRMDDRRGRFESLLKKKAMSDRVSPQGPTGYRFDNAL
jgi:hypothetical protein